MDRPLKKLTYLAIDCQSTGNSPQNNHLLEIGWQVFNLSQQADQDAGHIFLIQPPEDTPLSTRIQKLTGIETSDLTRAVDVNDALDALLQCARDVAKKNGTPNCPAVIHYARFEMGFIEHALKRLDRPFRSPLDVICTHQVATRLLPQLPRKGLRAVAGYLGYSVPEFKRCRGHLHATQWIWRHMVERLAAEAGVETLNQLKRWLSSKVKPDTPKRYPMPESIRKTVPADPGVYYMKRGNGDLLYIGKAANLRQRVNSYFHQSRRHPEHVLEMLTQAKELEVTPTATALEAALLETDAIKQSNPQYNIALVRSHRGVFYVSRNFQNHAPDIRQACPLGPVPSVEPFAAVHALGRRLRVPDSDVNIDTLMAMPLAYCPDQATLNKGLAHFKNRYGHVFEKKRIGHAVVHIGHLSWLQKLEEKNGVDEADSADAPEPEKESTAGFVWTPEAIADCLESICRRCGFLLRRARWLRMLGQSQVVWQMKAEESKKCHALSLRNGTVVEQLRDLNREALLKLPLPNGVGSGLSVSMDLETYDRLRVLTTEIRRLVAENRLVYVRLAAGVHLYPDQLRTLMRWI